MFDRLYQQYHQRQKARDLLFRQFKYPPVFGYDIDEELPWHSTISRTRQLYGEDVFKQLFEQVFEKCIDSGMIAGHTQAIDSAFLKANASKDSLEIKQVSNSIDAYLLENIKANTSPRRPAKINRQMISSSIWMAMMRNKANSLKTWTHATSGSQKSMKTCRAAKAGASS